MVRGIAVVPACECVVGIIGGVGRLQRFRGADVDEPLGGGNGAAAAVQVEADGVVCTGNGTFRSYILNAAVVDAAADGAVVRDRIIEQGAAVGACVLNFATRTCRNRAFDRTAVW